MLSLFPITKIMTAIAIIYSIIVILILSFTASASAPFLNNISVALRGAFAINLFLVFIIYYAWRKIWHWFPTLNTLVFPDLNGQWEMYIDWNWQGKNGTVVADAHIKQSFIKISMEVESVNSDSETLLATPKKDPESGRPILYYIYRTLPKKINGNTTAPYEGAAILKLDHKDLNCLKGNYFTNNDSHGHYTLKKRAD